MKALFEIFRHEIRSLVRSASLPLLVFAAVGWIFLVPHIIHGDGTAAGEREITIAYSLGGAFTLTVLALVASATASFAREREMKRLQLTQIRPVPFFLLALGKLTALVLAGCAVLVLSAAALAFRVDTSVDCRRILKPLLPSPREEAAAMYGVYMADPETPENVKKASKTTVLRILENRAIDHYQTLVTNTPVAWKFAEKGDAVRLRLTNPMELRQEVRGVFRSNGKEVVVSNMTQTVLTVPFENAGPDLGFENRGGTTLMLRPRKDVEILKTADGFIANSFRAVAMLTAMLALILAFALLLSAGLGRGVAVFTVMAFLFLGVVSPSVVEQYPDELTASLTDRIGLELTRFSAAVTRPVSAYSPIEHLSKDECIEYSELGRAAAVDLVLAPLLLLFLTALILPGKQDGL